MNLKKLIMFILIIAIVATVSYSAIYGLDFGKFKLPTVKDNLELGLDLAGGVYVLLEAQTDDTGVELDKKMDQAIAIIRKRVDSLGVSVPNIVREGTKRIRIELAGISDTQQAIDMIGKTAQLEFIDPEGNVVVTGKNVKKSEVNFQQTSSGIEEPVVSLEFDKEGTERFAEATARLSEKINHSEKIIHIVLDGTVISSPAVNNTINNGKAFIEGGFDIESASELATLIRAGALPVDLVEVQTSMIGPTLGLESLDTSVYAAAIGIILIFLFMLLVYRISGFLADVSLTIYVLILLGIMIALGVKLTLPGVAGLILSIGMAVDANVVIFERIKEELRVGKTLRTSIDRGFKKALSSVLDANVTTFIAGLVLFYFGSGPIKGFGVTLIIGIFSSMITAVFISKFLLKLFVGTNLFKDPKFYCSLRETKNRRFVNVVKRRNVAYIISAIIIVTGIIYGFSTGFNLGLDFTGGTLMQIDFNENIPVEEIREITDTFDTKASIIHAGSNQDEIIIKSTLDLDNQARKDIYSKFQEEYNLSNDALVKSEKFGPSIGSEIQRKALLSIFIATMGMLVYISFRFELKFGLAAIIALIHDVLIALAVYAIFKLPLDSSFVAAMLTIVGYSINDTIVVFDRLRENLKFMKKEKYEDIVNTSIKQTISRTINTSLTTLLAIGTLYVLGVDTIKDFAFPLIVGVLVGTYSSIFIASPVWYLLKTRLNSKNKQINRV